MSLDSNNQLKFEEGSTTEPLTIMGSGMEEFPFGSKYVVNIEPLDGKDHFCPAPGLKRKIEEVNVDIGDVITVEKVAPSEKYQYGYFSVSVVDKGKGPQIAKDKVEMDSYAIGETRAVQPTIDIVVHELTLRVEKLEKMVALYSSEAGHKPGDEDIPF